uniref:protein-tyrosine-phosphatase n=1 Tax=Mastacembelus armatus TaxID=205130 RepID=A0A7N9B1L5_9TELE
MSVSSDITDYIYVGNLNAAYNGRTLCRNNIDSIIDMSSVPGELALKQRCFEDINECINASTEKRKRVLVHCRDGFSLAPTCIIQYLMVKQNMRLIAAYELLRAKYPVNIRECHQNFSGCKIMKLLYFLFRPVNVTWLPPPPPPPPPIPLHNRRAKRLHCNVYRCNSVGCMVDVVLLQFCAMLL